MVLETSLVVQCLRLCASNAGDVGSIPGRGMEILYALGLGQNLKQETGGFVLCVSSASWALSSNPGSFVGSGTRVSSQ